jgi:transposase
MQVDTRPDTMSNIASYYGINSRKLQRHYKNNVSGFHQWNQKSHAEDYLIFPENIGENISIDEVSLSQGELYTFVTNKNGRGKQGSLIAVIKGTLSKDIISVLEKIPLETRNQVKEVTLDMANNMELSVKKSFTKAFLVTDRFHVVKLVIEALQHHRVKFRWEELDKENEAIALAKEEKRKYRPIILENGDTPKQLLARCKYIIVKKPSEWTESQENRANILFKRYPTLKKMYHHTLEFRNLYELKCIEKAKISFEKWVDKTKELKIKEFNTAANTVESHFEQILNFFKNRSTNANAESFNAKIKLFRANLRGVVDVEFFLFRLHKLFA